MLKHNSFSAVHSHILWQRGCFAPLRLRLTSLAVGLGISLLLGISHLQGFGIATHQQEDLVVVRDPDSGERSSRRGAIVEWNQSYLELETISGRTTKIANRQIERADTTYTQDHQDADRLLSQHRYLDAKDAYLVALESELRPWVQRMLYARIIAISHLLDENASACSRFIRLAANEPDHRYWSIIPIPWRAERPDGGHESQCLQWTDSSSEVEQLIGAAWLINTSERSRAVEVLRSLSRGADQPVAQLAAAQLWRIESEFTDEQIEQMTATIASFPEGALAGPRFLVARARYGKRQYEASALLFMQTRILEPEALDLSAMALFEAARALDAIDRQTEAAIIRTELRSTFPETIWARQLSTDN